MRPARDLRPRRPRLTLSATFAILAPDVALLSNVDLQPTRKAPMEINERFLIKNVHIVKPLRALEGDLGLENGVITYIGEPVQPSPAAV